MVDVRHTWDVVGMVVLFQERISIEPDHLVCNARGAEEISDCFRNEQYNLCAGLAFRNGC